jgi:hypothetical protein
LEVGVTQMSILIVINVVLGILTPTYVYWRNKRYGIPPGWTRTRPELDSPECELEIQVRSHYTGEHYEDGTPEMISEFRIVSNLEGTNFGCLLLVAFVVCSIINLRVLASNLT